MSYQIAGGYSEWLGFYTRWGTQCLFDLSDLQDHELFKSQCLLLVPKGEIFLQTVYYLDIAFCIYLHLFSAAHQGARGAAGRAI